MASVVFMRGVNVGGHNRFQPSVLARELADLEVVNVGAAGTYVVRKAISDTALRSAILQRLPFQPELVICRAREIIELVRSEPFHKKQPEKDTRPFVTVMAKPPRTLPRLPLSRPAGDQWEVKIIAVTGRFAFSLWRRMGRSVLYPNEVVEKHFNVPATTRGWNTISSICDILND